MTIGGMLICSTCEQRIKLRHQVGSIYPVKVNIACNNCGKTLKGIVDVHGEQAFVFPDEIVNMEHDESDQVVSISTELPILKSKTNVAGPALTPFLAISTVFEMEELGGYMSNLTDFQSIYIEKLGKLITSYELFENKNWIYYLNHLKNSFDKEVEIIESFEHSAVMLVSLNEIVFSRLRTNYYKKEFDDKLFRKLIYKNSSKLSQLEALNLDIEKYIDLKEEFIKGVKLLEIFLKNVNSFLPTILLSYKNDFSRSFGEDLDITTFDFAELKHMFIEQFEYLSRISSLYFGLLNLNENGDFNNFGSIRGCSNLLDYCSKDNGIKKDFIKKQLFLNGYFLNTLNSQIRNGIGHLKTKYDPKTQIIKYFPYKVPEKKDEFKEIYLMDFAFLVYQQSLKIHDSLRIMAKFFDLTKS